MSRLLKTKLRVKYNFVVCTFRLLGQIFQMFAPLLFLPKLGFLLHPFTVCMVFNLSVQTLMGIGLIEVPDREAGCRTEVSKDSRPMVSEVLLTLMHIFFSTS